MSFRGPSFTGSASAQALRLLMYRSCKPCDFHTWPDRLLQHGPMTGDYENLRLSPAKGVRWGIAMSIDMQGSDAIIEHLLSPATGTMKLMASHRYVADQKAVSGAPDTNCIADHRK